MSIQYEPSSVLERLQEQFLTQVVNIWRRRYENDVLITLNVWKQYLITQKRVISSYKECNTTQNINMNEITNDTVTTTIISNEYNCTWENICHNQKELVGSQSQCFFLTKAFVGFLQHLMTLQEGISTMAYSHIPLMRSLIADLDIQQQQQQQEEEEEEGKKDKTIPIPVNKNNTIKDIKDICTSEENIPKELYTVLQDTLNELNDNATLYSIIKHL